MASGGGGSPCGACKFLRRRCEKDCIFAPHFSSEEGAAQFAAIHRVFGASNLSKLLRHRVPPPDRGDAVATVAYEAQARLGDPVYGCVAHIAALQSQVASLQVQVMQLKARVVVAHQTTRAGNCRNMWEEGYAFAAPQEDNYNYPQQPLIPCGDQYPISSDAISPRSSSSLGIERDMEEGSSELVLVQDEMGSELHALALRMMGK